MPARTPRPCFKKLRLFLRRALTALLMIQALSAVVYASAGFFSKQQPADSGFSGSVHHRLMTGKSGSTSFFTGFDAFKIKLTNFDKASVFKVQVNDRVVFRDRVDKNETIRHTGSPGPVKVYIENQSYNHSRLVLSISDSAEYRIFYRTGLLIVFICLMLMLTLFLTGNKVSFTLLFIFFLNLYFFHLDGHPVPLTGDEPHYLLQAQSIANDLDTDLKNQSNQRQYSSYYPNELQPHYAGNSTHSVHYPGLPVLLSLVFFLQKTGLQIEPYTASKWLISAAAAASASLWICSILLPVRSQSFRLTKLKLILLFLCALSTGILLPFLAHSSQIYPEIILVLFISFLIYYGLSQKNRKFSLTNTVLLVSFAGLLPLFHIKFLAPSVLSFLFLLIQNNKPSNGRKLYFYSNLTLLYILLLSAGPLYSLFTYKTLTGPYQSGALHFPGFSHILYMLMRNFFDADYGLFALSPVLILSVGGLILFCRRSGLQDCIFMTALAASVITPNLLHGDGLLGSCPVGRNMAGIYPLVAFFSLMVLTHLPAWLKDRHPVIKTLSVFAVTGMLLLSLFSTAAHLNNRAGFHQPLQKEKITPDYIELKTGISLHIFYFKFH